LGATSAEHACGGVLLFFLFLFLLFFLLYDTRS
jgi:hypothetical protein